MRIRTLPYLSIGLSGILMGCGEASAPALPLATPSVSAGAEHSCALSVSGAAFCWGNGASGRLGNGADTSAAVPVPVATTLRFIQISAGGTHTCALTSDRRAVCWGSNGFGQLGDGSMAMRTSPVEVMGHLAFLTISAGQQHTCGLSTGGRVFCWGDNEIGQLGQPAASDTICGLPCTRSPVQVESDLTFTALSAGAFHTCAVAGDARALCWGYSYSGQTGSGFFTGSVEVPYPVLTDLRFTSIAAAGGHSCAIAVSRLAYCWGGGVSGQLGNDSSGSYNYTNRPVAVTGSLQYVALTAGDAHTCGLLATGAALCWGAGPLGTTATSYTSTPIATDGGHLFANLDAGGHHQCGVTVAGAVYCWGDNSTGQLGTGSSAIWTTIAAPVALPSVP